MDGLILHGAVAFSADPETLFFHDDAYVVCADGICLGVFAEIPQEYEDFPVEDFWDKLIIPGMKDLRADAVLFQVRGLCADFTEEELAEEIRKPEEELFEDPEYAERSMDLFVEELYCGPTTRALVYASGDDPVLEEFQGYLDETGLVTAVVRSGDELPEAHGLRVYSPSAVLYEGAELLSEQENKLPAIKSALGSGPSIGSGTSMFTVMRDAIVLSKAAARFAPEACSQLTFPEVFYMATRGGGDVLGKTGSFEPGYEFDAVVIDDESISSMHELDAAERAERLLYLADDRHVVGKYVRGQKLY